MHCAGPFGCKTRYSGHLLSRLRRVLSQHDQTKPHSYIMEGKAKLKGKQRQSTGRCKVGGLVLPRLRRGALPVRVGINYLQVRSVTKKLRGLAGLPWTELLMDLLRWGVPTWNRQGPGKEEPLALSPHRRYNSSSLRRKDRRKRGVGEGVVGLNRLLPG